MPVLGEAGYIGRNLPNSISEQHLVGVSEKQRQSDNKALLHDIDIRFENQDRTINYLLQQLNSMEQAVQSSQRKAFDLQERDRDNLLKVKNDLRNTGDTQSTILADM